MRVLITGTSMGIGYASALRFLSAGHVVEGLDVEKCSIKNDNYTHHICDVSEKESLPDLHAVHIVINNAGVQNKKDIEVNLLGAMHVTEKYALQPNIISVLNIASSSARTGAEFPMYAASKGGLVTYTKWVAQQIAKYHATCNSLSPGGVITDLNWHILKDKNKWNAVLEETMLKKWATAEEIAEWVYFLTVVNKSMTAQDILVDNGEFNKCNFIW